MKADMEAETLISVVIPVLDEEEVLPELYRQLGEVMRTVGGRHELVFVDDGSEDGSLKLLRGFAASDSAVRVVCLSRSFGHQAALSAGIDHARGDAVVTIDADLQDPPSLLRDMVLRWSEGAEVVYARRSRRRGEGLPKRASAFLFGRFLRLVASVPIPLDVADYRLMDRRVCDCLRRMPERRRYLRGMVAWAGFRQVEIRYDRLPRAAGDPKFRLGNMLRLAFDALSSFARAPLRSAVILGLAALAGSLVVLILALVGRPSARAAGPFGPFALTALLALNGVTLLLLGLLGAYVGRLADEVRQRPLYVVRELIGGERPG